MTATNASSTAAAKHPRRPPAHRSVSLRHSPPASATKSALRLQRKPTLASSPTAASNKANPPSTVSPTLLSHAPSSGESSDAGAWFDSTNKHAIQSTAAFSDNEPPFFLRNASSSETPPEGPMRIRGLAGIPHRPVLATAGTDGSSTEDFRGVIDDLTVMNKRLRQKLKKYEKMYDAHLQEEKLFEVRFHGLPDHKKKELEDTLRKFASELEDSASPDHLQAQSQVPSLEAHNTVSSTSRFAESGYVSMSASGQNSSAHSNLQEKDHRKSSKSAYNRQQQTIHSYLHDIPIGLLPDSNAPMADKARKKMVVRRLEQIFAGKTCVPGTHPQPMQQEEVAQSAASADREQREATGQSSKPEGQREARILPENTSHNTVASGQSEVVPVPHPVLQITEQEFPGNLSPDQRPTRPLDLDPARAQVPTENMDYIRHLGFTPPDMATGAVQSDGHGWIYLNLLINMAQLHTLNVTPDFVKDALHDYSSHLEMSRDGRKIRWKGGQSVTVHSASSSEHRSSTSPDKQSIARPHSKYIKTATNGPSTGNADDPEQKARCLLKMRREKEKSMFAYKPMFFRKEDSDDEVDMDVDSTNGSYLRPQYPAGNLSGFGNSAMPSSSSKPNPNPRRNDGPMIFYTKAKFCTDLSGDRLGATLTHPSAYKAMTSHPLGATSTSSPTPGISDITEPRGPMDSTPMDMDSSSGATLSSGSSLDFSPDSLIHDSGNNTPDMMVFEASGLGGVQPEDNFSVHVRRSQITTDPSNVPCRRRSSLYPQKIIDALSASRQTPYDNTACSRASPQRVIKEEILSASTRSMPSSTLPPASFLPFDSTSSGDMSDVSGSGYSEPDSESEFGPTTALNVLSIYPMDEMHSCNSDSDEESQYSVDTDDGSVDLLATARQLDPTTIRASEREYDAALAERIADVIPAGSSAATAAGGSGFNTPAKDAFATPSREGSFQKAEQLASGSTCSRTRSLLKRSRTSESITTVAKKGQKGQKSLRAVE